MAWMQIPSVTAGSLAKASDIGNWLATIQAQANSIASTHCSANNTPVNSTNKSANNGGNNGIWTSNSPTD